MIAFPLSDSDLPAHIQALSTAADDVYEAQNRLVRARDTVRAAVEICARDGFTETAAMGAVQVEALNMAIAVLEKLAP
jgi:uncharacterized protein (DUF2345 family)